MALTLHRQSEGHYSIEGDLTFAGIGANLKKLLGFWGSSKQVTVDLAKVGLVDSAGLALLVEWKKQTSQHQVQLLLKNIPKQLLMLAQLGGLDLNDHFTIQPNTQHHQNLA